MARKYYMKGVKRGMWCSYTSHDHKIIKLKKSRKKKANKSKRKNRR
jgi:hypothetical protein